MQPKVPLNAFSSIKQKVSSHLYFIGRPMKVIFSLPVLREVGVCEIHF